MLVLVDPLLDVVSESFAVSDLLTDVDVDVDVAESLVDEVAACESLELEGAMTVMVTTPEAELSVARSEPINSAIDVLIGCELDVKDDDSIVELLELDVVKPPNQALKLGVADKELDKLTVVDGDVTRESVEDGAKSKLLEWLSDNDAVVDVELLLVVEAGENSQSAEVDESSVLEALVLRVLEIGVLD
ncbi:hypothetical protein IW146_007635 [Coemansia sp. RSA 922]|nr:hypothetical protein IW146_007635 [Coemansia sp. RSA 922]